jgi:DNA-directed RNA polymerase subunit RPC12/RpoP
MNSDYSSEVDPLLLFPLSADISSWGKLLSQPYTQERQRVGLREYRCALCWKENVYVIQQEIMQHAHRCTSHRALLDEHRKRQQRMIFDLCPHVRIQTLLMQPQIQQLGCLRQQNNIQKELLSHFHAITTCSSFSDYIVMPTAAQQLDRVGSRPP